MDKDSMYFNKMTKPSIKLMKKLKKRTRRATILQTKLKENKPSKRIISLRSK